MACLGRGGVDVHAAQVVEQEAASNKIVDENGEHEITRYLVKDGVLYNKDMSVLVEYPAGKKDKSYTVAAAVTEIYPSGIERALYMEELILPEGLEVIGGISDCKKLKTAGKSAIRNIHAKAKIKVPSSKVKDYEKLLTGKTGFVNKTMKIKK